MMIWVMAPRKGKLQLSLTEAARVVAEVLREHWIWSNVYLKSYKNVKTQIENNFQEFKKIKSTAKVKQTDSWKTNKLVPFLDKIKNGMDIRTNDVEYLVKMEKEYGVKMTDEDKEYRDDQVSGQRKMYCQSFADKRWLARVERRRREEELKAAAIERDTKHQEKLFSKVAIPEDMENEELGNLEIEDRGNSCRSGTGPIFIPNIVKSLLSVLFSGLK